ncbi:MAG: MBL fold metallo-hydrolase [Acidaminococcus sp.]|nr:MBL fold metallo-hydrolase [Acidaminococcus sp.]
MKFTVLIDDKPVDGFKTEHGLSIYAETGDKKILIDTGASPAFTSNAETLGVDLSKIDCCFLSHGHNDHCGGLESFLEKNHTAKVYLQVDCFSDLISMRNGERKSIGLDSSLLTNEQIIPLDGGLMLDDDMLIFKGVEEVHPTSSLNLTLFKRDGDFVCLDEFEHEQYLLLFDGAVSVLICGCAHLGIANAMERAKEITGEYPMIVIGGFHIQLGDLIESDEYIEELAQTLKSFNSTYYTMHCTGIEGFKKLKEILGDDIKYLQTGDTIEF